MEPSTLPEYERPPVDEVIFSVQFRQLRGMLIPHFGLLWEQFRDAYPECSHSNPLIHVTEDKDGPSISASVSVNELPLPRVWFLSADGNGVIQIQQDRFLVNWRRRHISDIYPGFTVIRGQFEEHLSRFESFLRDHDLGHMDMDQFELSYVDVIARGDGWSTAGDVGRIFPDLAWRTGPRFLDEPQTVSMHLAFGFPENNGRMHVSMQPALRTTDGASVLRFEMTVRGAATDQTREERNAWFERARNRIVLGFADLASEEVQRDIWHRR